MASPSITWGEQRARGALVDPRVRRVGGDDPQAADRAARDALDDLIVGEAGARRDPRGVDAEDAGDLGAVLGAREVVAAEQVRRVGEKPRAHRVALPGDRVGAGALPADVAGQ